MRKIVIALFLTIGFTNLFAQQTSISQALVYFQSGVTRNPDATATITSQNILNVLGSLNIPTSNVIPAFPEFSENDTLLYFSEFPNEPVSKEMNKTKIYKIICGDTLQRNQLIANLQNLSEVLFVQENGRSNPLYLPNDPEFSKQWGLKNSTNPGKDIHAEQAWDIFRGSANSIIGVIDWGFNDNHPDLQAKIVGGDPGYADNPIEIHGFMVAGIAAAITDNSSGVSGVDHFAKLYSKRIDYDDGSDITVNKAITNAVQFSPYVKTLTQSYEHNRGYDEFQNPIPGRYSVVVRSAIATAYKQNRVSCFGSGNHNLYSGGRYASNVSFPGAYNTGGALTTAATTNLDLVPEFSGRGQHVDVAAPGTDITCLTAIPSSTTQQIGTSLSAAFVGGLASLLYGYKNNLYNDDIENIIKLTADDVNSSTLPSKDNELGHGRINAEAALKVLQAPNQLFQLSATGGQAGSATNQEKRIFLGFPGLPDAAYLVRRVEVTKAVVFPTQMCNIIGAWGRGVGTTGYREEGSYCYGEGICEVVPSTLTNSGATLRTWVYEVWSITGQYLGYYPRTPQNVEFKYTVLGVPTPTDANLLGKPEICTSETYQVDYPLGTAGSVSWTITPSGIVSPSPIAPNQIVLNKLTNGTITLTAQISNVCGTTISISKQIVVGNSSSVTITAVKTNAYGEPTTYEFTATPIQGATYKWYRNGILQSGYTGNVFDTYYPCNTTVSVYCKVVNTCGEVQSNTISKTGECIRTKEAYMLSPNPASSTMTVSTVDASNGEIKSDYRITEVKIYDQSGLLKKQVRFGKVKTATLNISSLPSGVYMVEVIDGDYREQQQLLIKR